MELLVAVPTARIAPFVPKMDTAYLDLKVMYICRNKWRKSNGGTTRIQYMG